MSIRRGGDALKMGVKVAPIVAAIVGAISGPGSAQSLIYDSGPVPSANKRYVAVQGADQRSTVVFKKVGQKGREKLWEIPVWSPALYLADDGEYLVLGYEGGNLLSHGYRLDQVMVSFYRRATLIRSLSLKDVILDPRHLEVSDSGVQWGFFVGLIGPTKFALDTVERRRLIFDIATGALLQVTRPDRSSLLPPS